MEQPPHQPRDKTCDRMIARFCDADMTRDRSHLVRQQWLGGNRQGSAGGSGGDKFSNVLTLLLRDRCKPGKRATIGSDHMGRITDNETIGMTGNREILFDYYGSVWRNRHTERS